MSPTEPHGPPGARSPMPPLDLFGGPLSGITLVEASAGTGKTWAICGLVLRLLLERGLLISQVLVVTFTKAATAELRERIRERIGLVLAALRGNACAKADPFVEGLLGALARRGEIPEAEIEQRLATALATFDEAAITTIHSFCQRALAEAPLAAGAPLAQTLLLDDSALREQVAQDLWRWWVAAAPLPAGLAEMLVDKKDSPETWARWLKWRAAEPMTTLRWPDGLAGVDNGNGDASARDSHYGEESETAHDTAATLIAAHAEARAAWPHVRDEVLQIVETARAAGQLSKIFFVDESKVRRVRDAWDAAMASTSPFASADLKTMRPFGNATFKAKKGQPAVESDGFFESAQAWLDARRAHDAALSLHRMRLLRRLLQEGPPALAAAKRAARAITFADMLTALHAELYGPRGDVLAAALRARYPAALIDEFQDTDPLQWGIFERFHGGRGAGPLVMVGDPKQSIYSFRQADLHTYLRARAQADHQATLVDNQRAQRPLVDALNALFGHRSNAFRHDGLAYHAVRYGNRKRPAWLDRSAARAPLQLWSLPDPADGVPDKKDTARELVAAATAGEIARLLRAAAQGDVQHDGRALSAGDIAVLVRTHAQGAQMRQALRRFGVGSIELSNASVWDSIDAEAIDQWLAAVLSPQREGLVRTALAGITMGWTASALHAVDSQPDAAEGLAAAMQRLADYRTLWRQRGVAVMLRRWLADDGVAQRLLASADGERRLTNLLHIADLLQTAAAGHASPESLHRWLQQQRRDKAEDDEAQQRLESDRHLVQIVTVHKSKGLEYPVVFCPFLWDGGVRAFNPVEGRQYHDSRDGADVPVRDLREPDTLDKDERLRLAERVRSASDAETMRLVYVALTRAVQRCYLVVGRYRAGARSSTTEADSGPLPWLMNGDAAAFVEQVLATTPGVVDLSPLPPSDGPALESPPAPVDSLAALPPPKLLPAAWVLSSYSRLTQSARGEAAAQDHDTQVFAAPVAAGVQALAEPVADDDILRFPRGAAAGECLHAAFELADFADHATWPAAIRTALAAHPQAGTHLTPQMHGMLAAVLHTPLRLGDGRSVALSTVPRAHRLAELEFMLPGGTLRAATLAALLKQHGEAVPPLAFHTLQGPVRGFVDLVFEHEGRFHVLDWKSNHLGNSAAHYGTAPLTAAMAEHGYGLQRLLYVLALHRHLCRRLPGYVFEQHMGEALYLFVRGVRPAWPGAGVVAHRPSRALVEGLSDWLDGR